jgi:hypothetical protein
MNVGKIYKFVAMIAVGVVLPLSIGFTIPSVFGKKDGAASALDSVGTAFVYPLPEIDFKIETHDMGYGYKCFVYRMKDGQVRFFSCATK